MTICQLNYAKNLKSLYRKKIIVKPGLSESDKLDIFEQGDTICMLSVAVYPKKYLDELRDEIDEAKAKIASGEQPVFDSVDALFAKLETNSLSSSM